MADREGLLTELKVLGKTSSWDELAEKYQFKNGEAARNFVKSIKKKDNLVLRSKWQVQTKGGGTAWLESYRARESEFLDKFQELKEEFLEELKQNSYHHKPHIESQGYLLEIGIPDFHLGKYVGSETLEMQKQKFIDNCLGLYKKAVSKYKISHVLLPIGNDFLNSDTLLYTSTKGTPQHDNASWKESFRAGWSAVVQVIDEIAKEHNIHVPIVQGNHDYQRCFYLGEVLVNRYYNTGVVTVDNTMEQRKYYKYGKNLFGYTHGNNEKHLDLPIIMATENPVEFAECNHKFFRLGHLHKHIHNEHYGVGITVLPSLSKPDEWLKSMGFDNLIKRCQGYIFDKDSGLDCYIQYSE